MDRCARTPPATDQTVARSFGTHGQEGPPTLSLGRAGTCRTLHSLGRVFPDPIPRKEAPTKRGTNIGAVPSAHHRSNIVAAWPMHHRAETTTSMLRWVLTFLIIAIVAGIFGFGGIAAGAAEIAKVIFFIFIVLLLLSLIFGRSIWKQG